MTIPLLFFILSNMKRLKWGDFLSLGIAMAVIGLLGVKAYGDTGGAPMVLIETDEGRWIYSLDEDRIVEVSGALGNMVVEIHGGTVAVLDAPCWDQICVQTRPLKAPRDWAACLPGRVFIHIWGEEGAHLDDISF